MPRRKYKPKEKERGSCAECGEPFLKYRPKQKFCPPKRGKNCRWRNWQKQNKRLSKEKEIISKAMSALAKRGAEKRRKLKQEALKEDHETIK